MTKTFSFLAIAAAALSTSAILLSPAAYAADAALQTKVSWRDLDLRTDAGQRSLARRTEAAANAVCPSLYVTGSHLQDSGAQACRASVRTQVARQVAAGEHIALSN